MLRNYDYKEQADFEALMPKVMEKLPTVGSSEENVSAFELAPKGVDALEVVDTYAIMNEE